MDLLGDERRLGQTFPPEHRVENFENNAETHQANSLLVERYWEAAHDIALRAVDEKLGEIAPCESDAPEACATAFIEDFGSRAFRRPIDANETQTFVGLFRKGLPVVGYAGAIAWVLEAMLQSPQFLYRVEAVTAPTEETGAVPLGPYEVASRLSYFLWDTMPDEELFTAARENRLSSPEEVEAQARRLLEHENARGMVREFYRQWLDLGRLNGLARDNPFTSTTPASLMTSLSKSLLAFLTYAHFDGVGTFESLFTSSALFVNADLATLYRIPDVPADGSFVAKSVPDTRSGLLSQPALLTLLAHSDQSSPIQRGVFVRSQLLCDPPQPPPPTVNNNPPDPDPTLTTRERFRIHTEEAVCAGCHIEIDNIGFAFEKYDQLGRHRAGENGATIDDSGEIVGAPDPALDGEFSGVPELSARLGQSATVEDCLVTHWYRYTMGRIENASDACSLSQARQHFRESGGDLTELLVGLTQTDAFLYRPPTEEDNP